MYGLIGRMTAVSGQRDALIDILIQGVAGMPGCLSQAAIAQGRPLIASMDSHTETTPVGGFGLPTDAR